MKDETGSQAGKQYKIVLIGDSGVGKSNILRRFKGDQFTVESKTTLAVAFASKDMLVRGEEVKVQVWDTAGQERYRSIAKAYYKNAVGALLVYDITKQSSFKSVNKWLNELYDHAEYEMAIGLIGNKSDLTQIRAVKTEEGMELAKKHNMMFLETSALDSTNIDLAFNKIVECK